MYTDLIQLENELDEFLYHFGYQVIDLQSAGLGKNRLFRLFVDRVDNAPTTVDDCSAIAPQVILFLEQKKLYDDRCSLEVSSGGLDRLLKRDRDLERYLGSTVRITVHESAVKRTLDGELLSFTDDVVVVMPADAALEAKAVSLARANVDRIRLVPQLEF